MIKMKIQLDGSNCSKATNIESVWSISSEKIMSKSPVVLKSVKIEEFFRIQNCNSLSQSKITITLKLMRLHKYLERYIIE